GGLDRVADGEGLHRLGDGSLDGDAQPLRHWLLPLGPELGTVVADVSGDEGERGEVQAGRGAGGDDVRGLPSQQPESRPARLEVEVPYQGEEGVLVEVGGIAPEVHVELRLELHRPQAGWECSGAEEGVARRDV